MRGFFNKLRTYNYFILKKWGLLAIMVELSYIRGICAHFYSIDKRITKTSTVLQDAINKGISIANFTWLF